MRFSSHVVRAQVEAALESRFPSALSFVPRPQPEMALTGIAALDTACRGLPRGALTEVCGPESSGRTTLLLSLLARMTGRQEACALIDAGDSFSPHSATAAGVDLSRLLWVRCKKTKGDLHVLEQALKAADQILQGGGFGLVVMDLAALDMQAVRRVPLASWFRFRRAVEDTPTVFLILEREASAKTCASLVLQLRLREEMWTSENSAPSHAQVLGGMKLEVEVARRHPSSIHHHSALLEQKKPATAARLWGAHAEKTEAGIFHARTEWAV